MAPAATLLPPPAREPARAVTGVARTTTQPPPPCPEDLHLAERVNRALRATGYGRLRAVVVSVRARVVTLEGQVPSYHLKQVAQAAALAVPGAHQVRNSLNVVRPS